VDDRDPETPLDLTPVDTGIPSAEMPAVTSVPGDSIEPVTEPPGDAIAHETPSPNDRLVILEAPKEAPKARIIAYARVSTEDQDLGTQTAKFQAYALAHDVELVVIESDKLSGKDTSRPGLQRALAMLERGEADGLLVAKLDRLTRSIGDFDALLDKYFRRRFGLFSIGDSVDTRTASGRLVLNILMSVAEWERETIGERTTDGLAHKRATGGGTPRIEGLALERIRQLDEDGKTLREIAEELTKEGIPTLKGGKWAAETVRRALSRARRTPRG
jgi:site-specific DNA recombinase